ncbi:uncharacterized protein BYT42DRAFT_616823 [Radiomyces spectabilis]|uniref:uncharacterized protein n=1 Tax=Radiomyces spectabilis TaxID=64574 RepID=UPI002220D55A|nr:uncharacterized protein BYT42DRAFT_616823 [Radiomyces spectabilis]KAI8371759.1 hypothetical protein BYT42DRAFT_616823 [Radiomyces spectabilis]
MKEMAEEDYIAVVNAAAKFHEDVAFHQWAINMKMNQYRALQLVPMLEYWHYLAEKEKNNLARDKAAGISLQRYHESFGTIVGRFGRSFTSDNSKNSYFKTLTMNNILDLSDDSEGSHLAQVTPKTQNAIKDMLHKSIAEEEEVNSQCEVFERIIRKFKREENEDRFLAKVVKEVDEARSSNAYLKRIYLQM